MNEKSSSSVGRWSDRAASSVVNTPAIPDLVSSALLAETLARLLLHEAMGGKSPLEDELVEGYAAPYRDRDAVRAFLVTARSIVTEQGAEDVARRYGTIAQPVLLVWCRRDHIVPVQSGKRLASALRQARLVTMRGCHHLPQHEKPKELLRTLDAFLER